MQQYRGRALRLVALLCTLGGMLQSNAVWADPAQMALGKLLFTQQAVPACAVCHTLKDAGSEGTVGPVLDELKPDQSRVINALRNGIGIMPRFAGRLSEEQIQALAVYVAAASRGN